MRIAILGCLLVFTPMSGWGQWTENFSEAKATAAENEKIIFAFFTGSDWCPPCKQLERSVLSKSAFLGNAVDHAVLFKADYPRRKPQSPGIKTQNNALARQYGIRSFPTMLLLDANGKKIKKVSGQRSASNILAQIRKAHGSASSQLDFYIYYIIAPVTLLILILVAVLYMINSSPSRVAESVMEIPDPSLYLVEMGGQVTPYEIRDGQLMIEGTPIYLAEAISLPEGIIQLKSGTQLRFIEKTS
jgi:thioredoxin-related protein